MRNQRTIALENGVAAPSSPFVHYRLHENTEANSRIIRDYGNTGIFNNDTHNLGGSVKNFNKSRIICAGDEENARDTTEAFEFLRLDNLTGVGGMLWMTSCIVNTVPSTGSECPFYAGYDQDNSPGWQILSRTDGAWVVRYQADNEGPTQAAGVTVPADGLPHTVGFYIDMRTDPPRVYGYLDGSMEIGTDLPGGAQPPANPTTQMFSLMVGRNQSAVYDGAVNGDGGDTRLGDMRCLRFAYDFLPHAAAVMQEFHLTPREDNLKTLAGR